jgi:hypothetical protein
MEREGEGKGGERGKEGWENAKKERKKHTQSPHAFVLLSWTGEMEREGEWGEGEMEAATQTKARARRSMCVDAIITIVQMRRKRKRNKNFLKYKILRL